MTQSFKNYEQPPSFINRSLHSDGDTLSRCSSFFFKIQRKQDQRSNSKRSRKSEGSVRQLNFSGFYTKMHSPAAPDQSKNPRQNKITRDNTAKPDRKRTPTPAHSTVKAKQVQNNKPTLNDLELQLKICEVQRSLEGERVQKEAAERRAGMFQRKFKEKMRQLRELEVELQEYRKDKTLSTTNRSYSEVPSDKQSTSTIQTIKKNYWKLRIQQLEHKNTDLVNQNDHLKHQLANLHLQTQSIRQQCEVLKEQVFILSQKTQSVLVQIKQREINSLREMLLKTSSERQDILNKLLVQSEKDQKILIDKIGRLEIKVDFMNRRKNQEIQLITSRKDKDIATIRKKLSLLAKQTMELKKQLGSKQVREGVLNREMRNRRSSVQSLELSLSP